LLWLLGVFEGASRQAPRGWSVGGWCGRVSGRVPGRACCREGFSTLYGQRRGWIRSWEKGSGGAIQKGAFRRPESMRRLPGRTVLPW
jgi:hypothetical protein